MNLSELLAAGVWVDLGVCAGADNSREQQGSHTHRLSAEASHSDKSL